MERISEFQVKDIVNLSDGKRLGMLCDLEIDITTGQIEALVVSPNGKWSNIFQREEDLIIPWKKIKRIGKDIIFVEYVTLTTINGDKEEF